MEPAVPPRREPGDRTSARRPGTGPAGTGIVEPYLVGPGGLLDDDGHAARAYGTDVLVLVRPDGYIGLVADPTDTGEVGDYLRSL